MALFAFDGTWKDDKSGDDAVQNTNVVKFHDAYQRTSGQPQFYAVGIGARTGDLAHYIEGAFGLGEVVRLEAAYDALCAAWAGDDHFIDIVGFSRGAATTLDFCRMIQNRGIRQPNSYMVVEPNPQIRFLGVWDVVDGFGLGCLGAADFNFGHCLTLPKANLQYAFHALALDERRPSFLPTRLRGAWEVWFRGVHSDVGGGDENPGLNDITLKWMMSKARAAGLSIAQADIDALTPKPDTPPQLDKERGLLKIRTVSTTDRRHYSVKAVPGCENPASTCPIESDTDEITAVAIANTFDVLPQAVQNRIWVLVQTALATAKQLDFSLDGAYEGLFDLIEHRVVLVNNDADLRRARISTVRLVNEMVAVATAEGFIGVLNDFFLTAALFRLAPIFPFTD